MDFVGDVAVSLLGSLGSLGVAWVIYKATRSDEADRLERTFAAERQAKAEDQARERRQANTHGLDEVLRAISVIIIQVSRSVKDHDPDSIHEFIDDLPTHHNAILNRVILVTRQQPIFNDLRHAGELCMQLHSVASTFVNVPRTPMQSWFDEFELYIQYGASFILSLRNRIHAWEDTGVAVSVNEAGQLPQVFISQPAYASRVE